MASLVNPVIVNNGASSPYGNGVATIIEGLFPPSTASVDVLVGELNSQDYVEVVQLGTEASFAGFVYDHANSTFDSLGGTGLAHIICGAGGNSPGDAILIQVRVFRNP